MTQPKRQAISGSEWERAEQEDQAEWASRLKEIRDTMGGAARKRGAARAQLAWLLDRFLYRDLRAITPRELQALRLSLSVLIIDVTGGRWRPTTEDQAPIGVRVPTRGADLFARTGLGRGGVNVRVAGQDLAEVRRARARVRTAVESIVRGYSYQAEPRDMGGGLERLTARLMPPDQTPMRQRAQVPRRRYAFTVAFYASLTTCLLMTALELLSETPPELLRWCRWPVKRRVVEDYDPPTRRAFRKLARTGLGPSKPNRRSAECCRAFVARKRQKWCRVHQEAAARERDRRAQQARRERLLAAEKRKTRAGRRGRTAPATVVR